MKRLSLFLLMTLMLFACSPRVDVPVSSKDSVYRNTTRVDSIYVRDSIYHTVYKQNDTVFSDKVRYRYRDKLVYLHDTVQISRTDSVFVPVKTSAEISGWQRLRMSIGDIAMLIGSIFAIIILTKKMLK